MFKTLNKIGSALPGFLKGIDKKFEAKRFEAKEGLNKDITEERQNGKTFEEAAIDVLLERLLNMEAAIELAKDFYKEVK